MFKITWDHETGGVLLSTRVTKETLGISPRPVFYEELDLLGLKEFGWTYPQSKEPIMWAVNKQYWYRGVLLFEAKGANLYDAPTVVFATAGVEPMNLEAIDVEEMLRRNADQMFLIESEAIEFIRDTYTEYSRANRANKITCANAEVDYEALAANVEKKTKTKMAVVREDCDSFDIIPLQKANAEGKRVLLSTRIDRFIASFSGGKDSQVVLDLCTRAMAPSEFEVIYSDTGYELPPSLELYEEVKRQYGERFPSLKFTTTRNHESVLNYWDKIGTPSDTHRWCCSVMKTAPLYRSLKVEGNKQARVLAFEGVRAEESTRRNGYERIGKGVKHTFVINARPIFDWSTTEIFLYLLSHDLPINPAYRVGKPRVGCILCPFGSPWDDMIVKKSYPNELKPFMDKIEKIVADRKIPNVKEYVTERFWKLRSSGTNSKNRTKVHIANTDIAFVATIDYPKNSLMLWLPTLGTLSYGIRGNSTEGYIEFDKIQYKFRLDETQSNASLYVEDNNNMRLRYYLRRIVYKDSYCINCEACEIECPTGALSVYPQVKIDTTKCIHCMKCIDYHKYGCIVADSLVITMDNVNSKSKISRFGTFGIQEAWVDEFLQNPETFWKDNSLGTKQVPSFKAWLFDADFVDEKGKLTELGTFFRDNQQDQYAQMWEVLYINLCYSNALFQWFIRSIPFNKELSRKDLEASIQEYFNGAFAKSSISYAFQAFLQVFKYSPIGTEFRQLESLESKNTKFIRNIFEDISDEALIYSIYRYAKEKDSSMLRVSDLFKQDEEIGLVREFGISRNELTKRLRSISTNTHRVIIAELNMGLDHITIREDLTALQAVKLIAE